MNASNIEAYLAKSRNPEGRERVLSLANDMDEALIDEEIKLLRALCAGLTVLIAVVLGAGYLL